MFGQLILTHVLGFFPFTGKALVFLGVLDSCQIGFFSYLKTNKKVFKKLDFLKIVLIYSTLSLGVRTISSVLIE